MYWEDGLRGKEAGRGWHNDRMEADLYRLLPLFERERARDAPVALAVVIDTAGSTYRKPGALMLICESGEFAGLLSGGCLEGDLAQHAKEVLATGVPKEVSYDMRGPDDLLWGLGSGCEGAMRIVLVRLDSSSGWEPLSAFAHALERDEPTAGALITESATGPLPQGTVLLPADPRLPPALKRALQNAAMAQTAAPFHLSEPAIRGFLLPLRRPPHITLLGAGPDAAPVAELATFLGWRLSIVDHRPAYADTTHFPASARVVLCGADEVASHVDFDRCDAAIVMSHHLGSDLAHLRTLAATSVPYVGLLGPPARREKLLADLGADARRLAGRLRAPIGLDLGSRTPESIALSIVAEIQATLSGRSGRPMSGDAPVTASEDLALR